MPLSHLKDRSFQSLTEDEASAALLHYCRHNALAMRNGIDGAPRRCYVIELGAWKIEPRTTVTSADSWKECLAAIIEQVRGGQTDAR